LPDQDPAHPPRPCRRHHAERFAGGSRLSPGGARRGARRSPRRLAHDERICKARGTLREDRRPSRAPGLAAGDARDDLNDIDYGRWQFDLQDARPTNPLIAAWLKRRNWCVSTAAGRCETRCARSNALRFVLARRAQYNRDRRPTA
jgi:hypothetical protein